eukprot:TRINITY_DN20999_c0_g1_i1.p1 TRINITY_DN20999_c0_g1~~TRINITY_DN20999_c0_g1_i1.p1  ORF type:complete len:1076 (-),score=190.03 TRINITY_DN20999_c0_g1_i1:171-3398(-)
MNKYDVLGVVGEGAYGVVLKCKNKDTNEVVAIKKFKESEEDEVVRKTTLREVKILRIMRHENIVQLKEAFRRKGKLYLVFEFVEKSLLDILEANPNGVDTETVRVLTCQLARAIEYCHRHDVIHRDIKPENLLINPVDNALRLCDFGFARTMSADSPLTDYVATRWYRAPELLLGSTHYGKDVDIWALGCIMGELTDGQPLFAGESEVDQLFVIQKVLGPLTPEHMEMFLRNPRFLGIQFPDVSRPETLEKRYVRRMPKLQMQLLKGVLVMEPRRRLSARDTLRMPWFEGIKLPRSLRPPSQSQSRSSGRPESSGSAATPQPERSAPAPPRGSPAATGPPPAQMPPEATPAPPSWHYEQQQMPMDQHHSMEHSSGGSSGGTAFGPGRGSTQREERAASSATGGGDFMRTRDDGRLRSSGGMAGDHHQHPQHQYQHHQQQHQQQHQQHQQHHYDDIRFRGEDPRGGGGLGDGLRMMVPPHHRGAGDMEAPRSAVGGHHHSHAHSHHHNSSSGHSHSGLGHSNQGVREDGRGLRDDPRGMRDDPRGLREDPRGLREDPRGFREDPRGIRDDRGPPHHPQPHHNSHPSQQPHPHHHPHHHGLQQPPHQQHHPGQMQHHHPSHPQNLQSERRHNQYMLPWEDTMPHPPEESPTQDYGAPSPPPGPPSHGSGPPQYSSDMDDKGTVVDGRRSRQNRRQAGSDDWNEGRAPSHTGPGDNRMQSNAERDGGRGGPSFFGPGSAVKGTRGSGGGGGSQTGPGGVHATGHPSFGSSAMLAGNSAAGSGCSGGAGLFLGAGSGVGAVGGGSGGGSATGGGGGGSAARSAANHGASAGTGGSEEWPGPSTQVRGMRAIRDEQYEDEKQAVWAQGSGLPRRKVGRSPAALGNVAAPQPRRSPEMVDPWQAAPNPGAAPERGEAWRGDTAPDVMGLGGGLGGLPSIHSSLLSGPQGAGLGEGSRAPSRLAAGTPTPRDEDSLDMATRQLHGFSSGARWNGNGSSAGDAGGDGGPGGWPGPGMAGLGVPGQGAPAGGSAGGGGGERNSGLGPVRDARVPLHGHDVRMQQDGRALGGLRRQDLSGMYHGH